MNADVQKISVIGYLTRKVMALYHSGMFYNENVNNVQ